MTGQDIAEDFDAASTTVLNTFFREYYLKHGQGVAHTLQRNLIQLFGYLEHERGWPSPYTDRLNRYAAVKGHPKTLSSEFVDDLLEVTGSGRARDFGAARDHAIIRILRSEGIRRMELLGMVMHSLSAGVIQNPVMLAPSTAAPAAGTAADQAVHLGADPAGPPVPGVHRGLALGVDAVPGRGVDRGRRAGAPDGPLL